MSLYQTHIPMLNKHIDYHGHLMDDDTQSHIIISDLL